MGRRLSDFFKSARVPAGPDSVDDPSPADPPAPRMSEVGGTMAPAVPSALPDWWALPATVVTTPPGVTRRIVSLEESATKRFPCHSASRSPV